MAQGGITREEIVRLYEAEYLGVAAIARRLGTNQILVAWHLGAAGVPLRNKSTAAKGRPKSPEHRAKLRAALEKARASQTEESRRKQAASMKGRKPPNAGQPWSDETREKHAYRQTPEYRERQAERQRGEKSHLWKGGVTDAERVRMSAWEWRERRKECYERDNWTCCDCGVHCSSQGKNKIQAHHVIPRRHGGSDELGNLVTLCISCHHKREWRYRNALIA